MTILASLMSNNIADLNDSGIINVLSYDDNNKLYAGTVDNYTALTEAIADLPTLGGIIYFPSTSGGGTYKLSTSITFPANCTLWFADGAKLSIDSGKTITGTNTKIIAERSQIFDGSGTVVGTWDIDEVYPEWFGAINDGTDCATGLQRFLTFLQDGQKAVFLKGTYAYGTQLTASNLDRVTFIGNGALLNDLTKEISTTDEGTGTAHDDTLVPVGIIFDTCTYLSFSGFSLDNECTKYTPNRATVTPTDRVPQIDFDSCNHVGFTDVIFNGINTNVRTLTPSTLDNKSRNAYVRFIDCKNIVTDNLVQSGDSGEGETVEFIRTDFVDFGRVYHLKTSRSPWSIGKAILCDNVKISKHQYTATATSSYIDVAGDRILVEDMSFDYANGNVLDVTSEWGAEQLADNGTVMLRNIKTNGTLVQTAQGSSSDIWFTDTVIMELCEVSGNKLFNNKYFKNIIADKCKLTTAASSAIIYAYLDSAVAADSNFVISSYSSIINSEINITSGNSYLWYRNSFYSENTIWKGNNNYLYTVDILTYYANSNLYAENDFTDIDYRCTFRDCTFVKVKFIDYSNMTFEGCTFIDCFFDVKASTGSPTQPKLKNNYIDCTFVWNVEYTANTLAFDRECRGFSFTRCSFTSKVNAMLAQSYNEGNDIPSDMSFYDCEFNNVKIRLTGNVSPTATITKYLTVHRCKAITGNVFESLTSANMPHINISVKDTITTGLFDLGVLTLQGTNINSTTWNPGSLNNGQTTSTTIAVTGAALGDKVDVSFDKDLQVQLLYAYVSAANTVTVVLHNVSGGTLDLASGTLFAEIYKR